MKELWKEDKEKTEKQDIVPCIVFSNFWETLIYKEIDNLIKNYPLLQWVRVRMSHHRYPNLSELFYWDLSGKVRKDIGSKSFIHRELCNCSKRN